MLNFATEEERNPCVPDAPSPDRGRITRLRSRPQPRRGTIRSRNPHAASASARSDNGRLCIRALRQWPSPQPNRQSMRRPCNQARNPRTTSVTKHAIRMHPRNHSRNPRAASPRNQSRDPRTTSVTNRGKEFGNFQWYLTVCNLKGGLGGILQTVDGPKPLILFDIQRN